MTSTTIAMVDYGAGNLASVVKGLEAAGAGIVSAASPDDLARAPGIVVPGVGHFASTAVLGEPWRAAVLEAVRRGTPLLGICLGMHWLFEGSDEAPAVAGLGLFAGRSTRLAGDVKVPHVGWNTLEFDSRRSTILGGTEPGAFAYFAHSYAAPVVPGVAATTVHGRRFASVVEWRRVYGVQFHPEKSGRTGLQILRNFVRVVQAG